MNLQAYGKHICVKEIVQEKGTELLLPPNVSSGKGMSDEVMRAEIVSIGDGADGYNLDGVLSILVPAYCGTDFAWNGDRFKMIQEHEILAAEYPASKEED